MELTDYEKYIVDWSKSQRSKSFSFVTDETDCIIEEVTLDAVDQLKENEEATTKENPELNTSSSRGSLREVENNSEEFEHVKDMEKKTNDFENIVEKERNNKVEGQSIEKLNTVPLLKQGVMSVQVQDSKYALKRKFPEELQVSKEKEEMKKLPNKIIRLTDSTLKALNVSNVFPHISTTGKTTSINNQPIVTPEQLLARIATKNKAVDTNKQMIVTGNLRGNETKIDSRLPAHVATTNKAIDTNKQMIVTGNLRGNETKIDSRLPARVATTNKAIDTNKQMIVTGNLRENETKIDSRLPARVATTNKAIDTNKQMIVTGNLRGNETKINAHTYPKPRVRAKRTKPPR